MHTNMVESEIYVSYQRLHQAIATGKIFKKKTTLIPSKNSTNRTRIQLTEKGSPETVSSNTGGEVSIGQNSSVNFQANSFVDEQGNEINIDYRKMLTIVKNANYSGFIGIEYEGGDEDEIAGILATKNLLIQAGMAI